jgi:hypothetical protein
MSLVVRHTKDKINARANMKSQYNANWRTVFLAYNYRDIELATKLYEFLTSIGVDVWFGKVNCDPSIEGNELRRILEKVIKGRDILLLITTENSLHGSWWVEQETNIFGIFQGEKDAERRLILVTFSSEVKDQSIIDYYFQNTGLNRFHKCDLISGDNIEHASEWGLQYYLNAEIPLSKFDKHEQ